MVFFWFSYHVICHLILFLTEYYRTHMRTEDKYVIFSPERTYVASLGDSVLHGAQRQRTPGSLRLSLRGASSGSLFWCTHWGSNRKKRKFAGQSPQSPRPLGLCWAPVSGSAPLLILLKWKTPLEGKAAQTSGLCPNLSAPGSRARNFSLCPVNFLTPSNGSFKVFRPACWSLQGGWIGTAQSAIADLEEPSLF